MIKLNCASRNGPLSTSWVHTCWASVPSVCYGAWGLDRPLQQDRVTGAPRAVHHASLPQYFLPSFFMRSVILMQSFLVLAASCCPRDKELKVAVELPQWQRAIV